MGTAETADQRQAENLGHTVRLEGAQFWMMLLGGQWTPHRSTPEPKHQPGAGPTSQQGVWVAAETFVQFSCSVVSDYCNPTDSSTPGLPVHHQLPEFTQTHVH